MADYVKIVKDFYNASVEGEWKRLEGRMEFILTSRMMDRYIKHGQTVLDIGGGPGRYSLYLAEKGCDVTLFDLSEENVAFARAKAIDMGLPLKAFPGDARKADKIIDGQYDHVLLMGPLYHLLEEKDRIRAVEAALNLLNPGGILYVSFINNFAGIVYYMKHEPEGLLREMNDKDSDYIDCIVNKRSYAGDAFTKAFFVESSEILPFMGQFPLEKLHLFGQEGVSSPCEKNITDSAPEVLAAWVSLCERLYECEDLLNYAEHLMYVGRKM